MTQYRERSSTIGYFLIVLTFLILICADPLPFRLFKKKKSKQKSESTPTQIPTLAPTLDPLSLINYAYLNISRDTINEIPCDPSPTCNQRFFLDYHTARSTMVNNRKKILMEYTPKAGCTAAVTMFMNEMGFVQNQVYYVWPHLFREEYFFKRCGMANPCMYEAKDWYRFKVVRNPYDRVVSSYIHLMKYPAIQDKIVPKENSSTLSFEGFLEILLSFPPMRMQGLAGAHLGYQSQPYERVLMRQNQSLFHAIVYSEHTEEGLLKVNKATNSSFRRGDRGIHLAERHRGINYFVGNLSWDLLKSRVPADYGYFYSPRIKALVDRIYAWDIKLYKYSFPFKMPNESLNQLPSPADSRFSELSFHQIPTPEVFPFGQILLRRQQLRANQTRHKNHQIRLNETKLKLHSRPAYNSSRISIPSASNNKSIVVL